jgi:transcriptional regulator with XRE-family HTH domain
VSEKRIPKIYTQIGKCIEMARKAANVDQETLAHKLGLTRTSVSNFENGKQRIQIDTLYRIAAYLGIDARDLLPPPISPERLQHLKNLREEITQLENEFWEDRP